LSPGNTLAAAEQRRIVDSTAFIVVSVYDAEAYLVLMSRDLERLLD